MSPAPLAPPRPVGAPLDAAGAEASAAATRDLLDVAFTRAAGAPLVRGNQVRLLRDAAENYPAWLDAIQGAERTVDFESYIIRDDASGERFAAALAERARAGVRVRLLYDWVGALGKTRGRFWEALRRAGVEVRIFNPLRLASPLGWVHRDHRKTLTVDGRVGFITGLCVGDDWVGDPARGLEPWRDTGVEVRGPAVAPIVAAFERVWAEAHDPEARHAEADDAPAAGAGPAYHRTPTGGDAPGGDVAGGDVAVRVVASEPFAAGLFRLDQLVAAAARERLWLTDAYFAGTSSYVQGLRAAARDGVDVRLLVPGGTDIPVLRPLSRAGYRPLLRAGVRVFEWNGPMLHAKTAVADGRWARVGSTNLNLASWLGNYEMDLVVEDAGFAREMEAMFLDDLAHATEVVLEPRRAGRRWRAGTPPPVTPPGAGEAAAPSAARRHHHHRYHHRGSAGRATAGAVRLGNTVGAAIAAQRVLDPADARIVAGAGALLLALAVAAFVWPRLLAVPLAVLAVWFGAALVAQGWRLWRRRQRRPT